MSESSHISADLVEELVQQIENLRDRFARVSSPWCRYNSVIGMIRESQARTRERSIEFEASPTGYPDEELFTVWLKSFPSDRRIAIMRILRDSGVTVSKVKEIVDGVPTVLYDAWVPGEDPRRDEAIDALKEFGMAELSMNKWEKVR